MAHDFPQLARRLTRRTIDLLVVAFVISAGLSVGQQLIEWWRADDVNSPSNAPLLGGIDIDWSKSPVSLQFGESGTSIERVPFRGNRQQLEDELTRRGQSIVGDANVPGSAIPQAEREWLQALQTAPPVIWNSDRGNVYRRGEPFPSFVATRFLEQEAAESAGLIQRIVGWGLAFPSTPTDWTIYVLHPNGADQSPDSRWAKIALPDGSSNITELTGTNGCQWRVFQGRGDLPSWVKHFHDQFGDRPTDETVDADSASLEYRRGQTVTDIQIRRERDGLLTGVIWSAKEGDKR